MSGNPKNVSVRDRRFYEPRTAQGILLEGEEVALPRIHECGTAILDKTWNYRGVCSPFWRAYFNLDPGAAVCVGQVRYPLAPGHLVLIPGEVGYDCISRTGVRHFWIHFSLDVPEPPETPLGIPLDPGDLKLWRRLARQAKICDPLAVRPLHYGCLSVLLAALARLPVSRMPGVDSRLRDLLQWFDANMAGPPSLDEMAARSGLGRRTFIRWFRDQTGSTPVSFMTRRRVRKACRLLRFGGASLEHIAETTGFANRHHFTRVFRAETGTGPSTFRKTGKALSKKN